LKLLFDVVLISNGYFPGDEVNWVQCDGCAEWFHLICEGLCKNDVSGDEEYICRACNKLSLAGETMELDTKKEPKEEVIEICYLQTFNLCRG
jgi:PHD-finger